MDSGGHSDAPSHRQTLDEAEVPSKSSGKRKENPCGTITTTPSTVKRLASTTPLAGVPDGDEQAPGTAETIKPTTAAGSSAASSAFKSTPTAVFVSSFDGALASGAAGSAKSGFSSVLPRLPLGAWPDEEQRQRDAAMRRLRRPELGHMPFMAGLKSPPAPKEAEGLSLQANEDSGGAGASSGGGGEGAVSSSKEEEELKEGTLLTQDQFLDYLPGPLQEESRCSNCARRIRMDSWECPFCKTVIND